MNVTEASPRSRPEANAVNPVSLLAREKRSLDSLDLTFDDTEEGQRNQELFKKHKRDMKGYEKVPPLVFRPHFPFARAFLSPVLSFLPHFPFARAFLPSALSYRPYFPIARTFLSPALSFRPHFPYARTFLSPRCITLTFYSFCLALPEGLL
jgi:hypothetical protein